MIKISILLTIAFAAICLIEAAGQTNSPTISQSDSLDYFPLCVANSWTYVTEWDTSHSGTESIYDTVRVGERLWFLHKGFMLDLIGIGPRMVDTIRTDSLGNVWRIDWNQEYQLFDFTQDSGTAYAARSSYPTPSTVYVTKNIDITVPAGRFQRCVELFFAQSGADESIALIFAPGIGIVKSYRSFSAPAVLLRAVVNGKIISSAEGSPATPPWRSQLDQNYPNPFNPTTVISYQLAAVSNVTLKVYDLLGREVAVLVNQKQNAGTHSIVFDAGSFPSGVYFYQLKARQTTGGQAGSFTDTKKLLLLR